MIKTTIKELKKGDFFTLKPIENPTEKQVYIRDDFCRENKKYSCCKFEDVNTERFFAGSKEVYTDFIF